MTDEKDEKPKLATGDRALLEALEGKGEVVRLTPELMKDMFANLTARMREIETTFPALVAECPYNTRLAVTAWAMKHICDHARESGSFRYLIYERMGFGPDAYVPLYEAGGMDISNEFCLPSKGGDKPQG